MNSLSSIDQCNQEQYWTVLATLDPELYRIKVALEETKVNPVIMPRIIKSIANLAYSGGYGKLQIFMEKGMVSQIKPEQSERLDVPALIQDMQLIEINKITIVRGE